MKTITVSQQAIGGLFQKNPNKGGWGYTFMKKNPGIFRFVTLSLEIRKKTSFHRWKFCKLCGRYPFWKFQRQKPRLREIPLSVFLEQPWKFHFFFNWLLELPHALSSIPLEIPCSRHPPYSLPSPHPVDLLFEFISGNSPFTLHGLSRYLVATLKSLPRVRKNSPKLHESWYDWKK